MTVELRDEYLKDWGVIWNGWLSGLKPKREASTHSAKDRKLRTKSNDENIESAKEKFLQQIK